MADNLLDKASILLTPTAYNDGRMLSVKPNENLYGSELVTNGNFATDSDWTAVNSGGWTISGGSANCDGTSSASAIYQQNILVVGKTYKITFTAIITSGTVAVSAGFSGTGTSRTVSGTYTEILTAATNDELYIKGTSNFTGSIDNVSVVEDLSGDFTFSRSSAATRVNAQGLVENVQIISSELVSNGNFSQIGTEEVSNGNFSQEGSELVTNGDFSNGLTNWSVNGGSYATIVGGALNSNNTENGSWFAENISQSVSFVQNKIYKVTFKAKNISGNLNLRITHQSHIIFSENITSSFVDYTVYYTAQANNDSLRIFCNDAVGQFQIDNVSVKEVGQDWSLGSGWSIGDDKALFDGGSDSNLFSTSSITNGKSYKYSFTISDMTTGALSFRLGSASANDLRITEDGTYSGYAVADGGYILARSESGFNGSITNISVKEVGQDWTFGTGWSVDQANSKVVGDGTMGANVFRQNVGFTQGNTYKFSFTIEDYVSGSIYIREPFNGYLDAASADGDYSFDYVAGMSDYIDFRGNSFVGSITNISVKEITDDTDLPRINYEGFSYQDSLGSEEIVNGDFATDSNWTKQTGWSIDTINGKAIAQNVPNLQRLQQNISGFTPVVGATYQYSFDISNVDGFYTVWAFGNSILNSVNTEGTITGTFEATSTNNGFYFAGATASGLVSATLDNVSVKEVLGQEVVPDSGCGSWLLEPQSTNLITYSSDLSSLNLRSNAVVTSNEVISPSGDLDADKITFDGTLYGRVEQTIAATVGQPYTISVYLKNKDLSDVTQVWIGFSQVSQGQFVTITDEWQRYDITTNADGSSEYPRIQFSGTGSLYAWGFQVEQQSYATSYIPTNGATNTRLQDIATNSGNSTLINSTEGVLYAEIAYLNDTGTYRTISINDGTNNNQVAIENRPISNQIKAFVVVGGVSVMNSTQTLTDVKSFNKMALKWKQNDFAWWVNGVQIYEDLSGSTFGSGVLNKLNFNNGIQNFPFEGKTKALVVYKEALTDAELQSLTTI